MRLHRRRLAIDNGERVWQLYLAQEATIRAHRHTIEQIMKMVMK